MEQENSSVKKKIMIILVCSLIIVVAIIGGVLVVHSMLSDAPGTMDELQNEQTDSGEQTGSKFSYEGQTGSDGKFSREGDVALSDDQSNVLLASGQDVNFDSMTAQEKFDYTLQWLNNQNPQMKVIDYEANTQTPAVRDYSLEWDRSLFYSLEDVSMEDPNDGLINFCNIRKVTLKNKATDSLVECEVYSDPNTNAMQKIVTIEQQKDTGFYEVWEYYFEGEDVNFIFYSVRDVYTPTYATPDKCGERYYYNHARLVKFRRIEVPREIQDFLLNKLTSYPDNIVAGFDNLEIVGLTRAYNIYHAVQNAPIYGTLKGYVFDAENKPISGALVKAHNNHYGKDVGTVTTNEEGYYNIMVPSDAEGDYDLLASAEGANDVKIYGVQVNDATSSVNNEMLYMPVGAQKEDEFDMEIVLCDALNVDGSGDSFSNMQRLAGAQLNVRQGVNNRRGEIYGSYYADSDGVVSANLSCGMYTGEIVKAGYANSYFTFAAKKDNTLIQSMTTPKLKENEVRIVLTWGAQPADLDSHLFTPYQGSEGNMQHIGYYEQSDAYGNNLDVDDTSSYGPETMTILNLSNGNYKYYVSNYSSLSSGITDDTALSESGATVRVYTSAGLTATFNVPPKQNGTIWEVFEIRNKQIIPIQRYYSNVEDKSWWSTYSRYSW